MIKNIGNPAKVVNIKNVVQLVQLAKRPDPLDNIVLVKELKDHIKAN